MKMTGTFHLSFVDVGPQRTGTSWLYEMLRDHPAICFPKDVKETMFFDEHYEKGLDWYFSHFDHREPHQILGEIAPSYFDSDSALLGIQSLNPQCKIIIHLRDPVRRAFSLYLHHRRKGRVEGSFREATQQISSIVSSGRYAKHIPKWLSLFGPGRVFFLLMEDIEEQPEAVLRRVCQFLGVSEMPMPDEATEKVNAATHARWRTLARLSAQTASWLRARRLHRVVELGKALGLKRIYTGGESASPTFMEQDQCWLLDFYEEDIRFVETLLNRRLPSWRQVNP